MVAIQNFKVKRIQMTSYTVQSNALYAFTALKIMGSWKFHLMKMSHELDTQDIKKLSIIKSIGCLSCVSQTAS